MDQKRTKVWRRSEQFDEFESIISAIDDSTWWIANRKQPFDAIYSKMKADAVARADMALCERIDTPTGSRWISSTRDVVTGKIVVGDDALPF